MLGHEYWIQMVGIVKLTQVIRKRPVEKDCLKEVNL